MGITSGSNVEQLKSLGNKVLMKGMKQVIGVMPIREPQLLVGTNALPRLAETIAGHDLHRILLVTTAGIVRRGQADELMQSLEKLGLAVVVFDGIAPDPTFAIVSEGLALLNMEECDGIVAFGGGSAMDAAKVMAMAAANGRTPQQMVGYFRGIKKPLPLFAVPTTAGTGSEATIASVISDDQTHAKAFVVDSRSVPLAAALEPRLTEKLSPEMTAATGMDALTHAVEAYVGTIGTDETNRNAEEAIKLIFEFLPRAFANGSDLEAREAMLIGSYKAGRAFTEALVGYVHAISHQLGAHYGTAHGLGNAIVLPHVLTYSEPAARAKLARLAVITGLGKSSPDKKRLAVTFIDHIRQLNRQLGIPQAVVGLRREDIPEMASAALKEAVLNYPVPRHMGQRECEQLFEALL